MTIKTGQGSSFAIGTTAAATVLADFQADTYTAVGKVETVGEFGDEREIVRFLDLSSGRVEKARGSADAGDQTVVFADNTGDAGQLALEAAYDATSQATDEFNFRVRFNDSLGVNATTFYYRGRITTLKVQEITNNGTIMRRVVVAINSKPIKQAAS